MDPALFERLLFEAEDTTLDFKKEQYRFARAIEEEKSELLKDILGFTNAWCRSDAYILIGIEEARGARSKVVGIGSDQHLDDHALQQFVNNLTQTPIRFCYEAFIAEGKHVGIIHIERQHRPVFLKRDYGKLKKGAVYVRRGSSTDPTKPAEPDEIARMGLDSMSPIAEIAVEFAEIARDAALGTRIAWEAELCDVPSDETLPDLRPPQLNLGGSPLHPPILVDSPFQSTNTHYFRELAKYEFIRRLCRPMRLLIRNVGKVAASGVRVELTAPANGVILMNDMPTAPQRELSFGLDLPSVSNAAGYSASVTIDKNEDRYRVEIDCGDLQPGRRIRSEAFYAGTIADLILKGEIFAANLPQPMSFALSVAVKITETRLSVDELCALETPDDEDD